jgi:hypothetical protein
LIHPLNQKKIPTIYPADKFLYEIARSIDVTTSIEFGRVVSSNTFPAPIHLFSDIKANQALSIDMETSAFYQVAWLLNIPVRAIRGISNILDEVGADNHIHDVEKAMHAASEVLLRIINALLNSLALTSHETKTDSLIKKFNLQSHPEGGYYARNYQSDLQVKRLESEEIKLAGTAIYYLLEGEDFSAWHKLKSDELWHFYSGDTLKIHEIDHTDNYTHIY